MTINPTMMIQEMTTKTSDAMHKILSRMLVSAIDKAYDKDRVISGLAALDENLSKLNKRPQIERERRLLKLMYGKTFGFSLMIQQGVVRVHSLTYAGRPDSWQILDRDTRVIPLANNLMRALKDIAEQYEMPLVVTMPKYYNATVSHHVGQYMSRDNDLRLREEICHMLNIRKSYAQHTYFFEEHLNGLQILSQEFKAKQSEAGSRRPKQGSEAGTLRPVQQGSEDGQQCEEVAPHDSSREDDGSVQTVRTEASTPAAEDSGNGEGPVDVQADVLDTETDARECTGLLHNPVQARQD